MRVRVPQGPSGSRLEGFTAGSSQEQGLSRELPSELESGLREQRAGAAVPAVGRSSLPHTPFREVPQHWPACQPCTPPTPQASHPCGIQTLLTTHLELHSPAPTPSSPVPSLPSHLLAASSVPRPHSGPKCHLSPWPHPTPALCPEFLLPPESLPCLLHSPD